MREEVEACFCFHHCCHGNADEVPLLVLNICVDICCEKYSDFSFISKGNRKLPHKWNNSDQQKAALFLVTRSACWPTAADTVLILKHVIKSNSAVSNGFLTSSNQSFHQLLCLRPAWSKNSNGKTILACLILAGIMHDTPTSYIDLLFPAVPAQIQLCIVQHCKFSGKVFQCSLHHLVVEAGLKSHSTQKCVLLIVT